MKVVKTESLIDWMMGVKIVLPDCCISDISRY